MAAVEPLENMQHEVSCPICLVYLKDPVTTQCGHKFCRACLTRCWEGPESNFPCPQCNAMTNLRTILPNRPLGNVTDLSRGAKLLKRKEREEQLCSLHKEPLILFFKEDQKAMCLVCDRSRHRGPNTVIPIEEAAQYYKGRLQDWAHSLKKNMESVLEHKLKEEETLNTLNEKFTSYRDRVLCAFANLREFIEQVKQNRLWSLEKAQERTQKMSLLKIQELNTQHFSLTNLITELEGKCRQQDFELLKDVQNVLKRCENVKIKTPGDDAAEMNTIEQSLSKDNANLQEKIKEIKCTFPTELRRNRLKRCKMVVTLDPDTSNTYLILSEDRRHVKSGNALQKLPRSSKRFPDADRCVLGKEGITAGRHYWEVQLLQEHGWCIGVATESNRKAGVQYSPVAGIWAVYHADNYYGALTSPISPLSLCEAPKKVGVFLSYDQGMVLVINAETMEDLYYFKGVSFTQKMFPFFGVYKGSELRLV